MVVVKFGHVLNYNDLDANMTKYLLKVIIIFTYKPAFRHRKLYIDGNLNTFKVVPKFLCSSLP